MKDRRKRGEERIIFSCNNYILFRPEGEYVQFASPTINNKLIINTVNFLDYFSNLKKKKEKKISRNALENNIIRLERI